MLGLVLVRFRIPLIRYGRRKRRYRSMSEVVNLEEHGVD